MGFTSGPVPMSLKASSNAFPIYRFPSRSLHTWASAFLLPDGSKPAIWYGSENTAKIRNFYEFVSLYPKKNENCFPQGL